MEALEAMRKVGGVVPKAASTTSSKAHPVTIPATGMFQMRPSQDQWPMLLPPYGAQGAFISVWGLSEVEELDGIVHMTQWTEQEHSDHQEVVRRYAIWQLQKELAEHGLEVCKVEPYPREQVPADPVQVDGVDIADALCGPA